MIFRVGLLVLVFCVASCRVEGTSEVRPLCDVQYGRHMKVSACFGGLLTCERNCLAPFGCVGDDEFGFWCALRCQTDEECPVGYWCVCREKGCSGPVRTGILGGPKGFIDVCQERVELFPGYGF